MTHSYVTQKDQFLLTSLPFNKRPFRSNHFELCNLMRVGRKQHILLYINSQSRIFLVFYWLRAYHVRVTKLGCLPRNSARGR